LKNTYKYLLYQQLLEREKQFSEEHQDGEKNRATLLKVSAKAKTWQ